MVLAWADNDIVESLRKSLSDAYDKENDHVSAFAKFRIDSDDSHSLNSNITKLSDCLSVFRNKVKDMCCQLKDWKSDPDYDLANIDFVEFLKTTIDRNCGISLFWRLCLNGNIPLLTRAISIGKYLTFQMKVF